MIRTLKQREVVRNWLRLVTLTNIMQRTFTETQRFTQWWLWILLLAIAALPIWGLIQQIGMGEPWGNQPLSDTGLILFTVFTFGLIGFFLSMKLKTQIDSTGITVRFTPFVKRQVAWADIESTEVLNYGFVGGWGIRIGTKYGTVYNMKGKGRGDGRVGSDLTSLNVKLERWNR